MGNGFLSLSASGLSEAAASYTSACNSYNAMLKELNDAITLVGSQWADEVGSEWNTVTRNALKDFDKISENLTANSNFLESVSRTSSDTQKKARAAVGQIF